MSISDLLPLVAAALNDKAAADASEELDIAREERDRSHRVEVIRSRANGEDEDEDGETVVYGCGLFEDGQYARNTNLWNIKLDKSSDNTCHLVDLRDCHICVGGGFPVASLDDTLPNNTTFEGWVDGDEIDEGELTSDACKVSFCFCPHSTWLTCLIHGWPREEWEEAILVDDLDLDEIIPFLVEDVAAQYPDATIEFEKVTFTASSIHGALKRLLSSKRKVEVRADRDRRIAERNPEGDALYEFVSRTMRERGNQASRALFVPQLYSILGFLGATGINRLGENDDFIMIAIASYERLGDEGLLEIMNQFGLDVDEENEDEE